jgi:hypothetical protein
MTRDDFERQFNSRTLAYHPELATDDRVVAVAISEESHNEPSHALLLALANLLPRAHRRLVFVGDLDRSLLCRDPLGATTLREATVGRALSINPFVDVEVTDFIPRDGVLLSIGIGCEAELRVGAEGWLATFGQTASVRSDRTSLLGVSLAAALSCAAAFHRQLGKHALPAGRFSLWDYGRPSGPQGPSFPGPVAVGSVLQAGAGAVANALDYWLSVIGLQGRWVVVDGDLVDVSNLNRQMLFLAADAGFPDTERQPKAAIAAGVLGEAANAEVAWIDEAEARGERYDLILPLANERGVRKLLQMRPEPLLLHAITTPNWSTIAHRHIAGRDGCLVCRIPQEQDVRFTCAKGEIGQVVKQDASLPFLSAAAGALLLAEIVRLQLAALDEREANYGLLDLREPSPFTTAYAIRCNEGCRVVPPAAVRETAAGTTRWASLSPSGDVACG